jgi:hypothetical protein
MEDAQDVLGYDEFRPDLDRYHFDFSECNPAQTDFCQIDTWQDASYYGIWANPVELRIVKFIESEVYRDEFDSEAAFTKAVRSTLEHNRRGEGHASIDPHGNRGDWERLGFGPDEFTSSE